jgi:hypothetical protein
MIIYQTVAGRPADNGKYRAVIASQTLESVPVNSAGNYSEAYKYL